MNHDVFPRLAMRFVFCLLVCLSFLPSASRAADASPAKSGPQCVDVIDGRHGVAYTVFDADWNRFEIPSCGDLKLGANSVYVSDDEIKSFQDYFKWLLILIAGVFVMCVIGYNVEFYLMRRKS